MLTCAFSRTSQRNHLKSSGVPQNKNQSICQHHQPQASSLPFISSLTCLHSLQHQNKPYKRRMMASSPTALCLVKERHESWRPLCQLKGEGRKERGKKKKQNKTEKPVAKKKYSSQIKPWVWSFASLDFGFRFTTYMNIYRQFNTTIKKAQSIQPRFLKPNIITSHRTTEVY